jgi:hypothetical protein
MDSSISPKNEIWFLRVCHHISKAIYRITPLHTRRLSVPLLSYSHIVSHPLTQFGGGNFGGSGNVLGGRRREFVVL